MVQRPLRYYYLRIVRQPGTPEQIAGGMALGLFVALVVPPPFQIVTAVGAAFVFKLNKISSIVGCFLTNPFTWPTIIFIQLLCGSWITGIPVPHHLPEEYANWWAFLRDFHSSWQVIKALYVGALVSAVLTAIVGYYSTKLLVVGFRQSRVRAKIGEKIYQVRHRNDPKPPAVSSTPGAPAAPPAPESGKGMPGKGAAASESK